MERSSRVLQLGNQKIWFFSKKFEIEFDLYFDLCWRSEINIQVGLNMHLYVDIGDTSSSLWGSTSTLTLQLILLIIVYIFLFIASRVSNYSSFLWGWQHLFSVTGFPLLRKDQQLDILSAIRACNWEGPSKLYIQFKLPISGPCNTCHIICNTRQSKSWKEYPLL